MNLIGFNFKFFNSYSFLRFHPKPLSCCSNTFTQVRILHLFYENLRYNCENLDKYGYQRKYDCNHGFIVMVHINGNSVL